LPDHTTTKLVVEQYVLRTMKEVLIPSKPKPTSYKEMAKDIWNKESRRMKKLNTVLIRVEYSTLK
jgi:hypothetical protein